MCLGCGSAEVVGGQVESSEGGKGRRRKGRKWERLSHASEMRDETDKSGRVGEG